MGGLFWLLFASSFAFFIIAIPPSFVGRNGYHLLYCIAAFLRDDREPWDLFSVLCDCASDVCVYVCMCVCDGYKVIYVWMVSIMKSRTIFFGRILF